MAENKIEILRFLQSVVRFNFNLKDLKGRTPITEALALKNKDIIELFN